MTLGQFFLGFVTIAIATLVYRWQKAVDRETAALSELRELLSRYAVLSHKLFLKQPYRDQEYDPKELDSFFSISDEEIELYTLRDQIYVTAPSPVVDAVLDCDAKFRNWKISFPGSNVADEQVIEESRQASTEFKFAHEKMLLAMRQEISSHNKMPVPDWLRKLTGETK
ncbi:hypothetical protein KBY28_09945 [Ruegeria pomeroyi]|uniref:hypothetical protein n=1 Tax=Ruegeria pomeroyi TaxID=89184 RepID=UPI001F4576B4|nr:hypothetical protein [Ruegeria pomeroyi]MCE8508767.1 hypothetical protein [Ruegeria pomeroyi]